ncbi:Uncharacterised protein [uncultured archaeon]|nr:Uncharacterised protein [uncultured archaeon]
MEPVKKEALDEIVGKKFHLFEKCGHEKIRLDGTIFTSNKIDYEFIYRIDLFTLGSVYLTKDDLKLNKEKEVLTLTKPAGAFLYHHDNCLFHSLQDFELRNKYLNQVGL